METNSCFHCGDDCGNHPIVFREKLFCCQGCKTVFEIFTDNNLVAYYELQQTPGATPKHIEGKYDFLSQDTIIEELTEYRSETIEIVTLYIPHIHCSSCIWILENLSKLNPNIIDSIVNFGKKTVKLTYNPEATNLKTIVTLLKYYWLRALY